MRVDFYTKDFTKIDLESLNVKTLDINVSSPTPVHERTKIDSRQGSITVGTLLEGRTLSVSFFIRAKDTYDFSLIRNELFNLFTGLEFLYLVDTYEQGKRWKVKVNNSYEIKKINQTASQFEIEFYSDSPYCESIGTTQDLTNPDADFWQYGQGLISEDLIYTSSSANFQVYNAGIKLDPRSFPALIEVTASQTSADIYMSLSNKTTGEDWVYRGATTAGQVFQLDGVQTLLGGASVSNKTNYGLISLNSGFNDISRNSGISQIKFINRFYYL